MAVGKVGGGGKKGGTGGVQGGGGVGKSSGAGFGGRVEKSQGAQGAAGASSAGQVQAADPITASAMSIAKQLKSGEIKTKEEATRKLVAEVLKEKVRMQSKALTDKISESLQDDPRISAALDRLWANVE